MGEEEPNVAAEKILKDALDAQKQIIRVHESNVKKARAELAKQKKIYRGKEQALMLWQGKVKKTAAKEDKK